MDTPMATPRLKEEAIAGSKNPKQFPAAA